MNISKIFATWFGLGNIKWAPGTFGSLGAYPLCYMLLMLSFFLKNKKIFSLIGVIDQFIIIFILLSLITIILLFFIAIKSINDFHLLIGDKIDHKSIVIDEVIGQTLSFALTIYFLYFTNHLMMMKDNFLQLNIIFIFSFVFFRIFDIYKPLFIGWLDKNVDGALGIIIDDVAAGIFSGVISGFLLTIIFYK